MQKKILILLTSNFFTAKSSRLKEKEEFIVVSRVRSAHG